MIGQTFNGYELTYDTFATASGDRLLIQKGRSISFELRLGYRQHLPPFLNPFSPVIAERTTLHLGTYFEPPRRDGFSGRVHGTGGLSYSIPNFLELMGGADVASDYVQVFFTFR